MGATYLHPYYLFPYIILITLVPRIITDAKYDIILYDYTSSKLGNFVARIAHAQRWIMTAQ